MRRGQFVFVSHASRDKPLIRFVVEALVDSGIGVWLDNPEAVGFSPDYIQQNFQRLKPGPRWLDQIHDALEASKCVLACCTAKIQNHSIALAQAPLRQREPAEPIVVIRIGIGKRWPSGRGKTKGSV